MPPPLILLHGFTQTRHSWEGVLAALREPRAVAPDLPGHGSSADRWPVSFSACAAYVRAIADGGPCTLCGYSMGGRIALYTALTFTGLVSRLVLIGASPGLADDGERAARAAADEALAVRIEAEGVEAFARSWGAQPLFEGQSSAVAEAAHEDRLRNTSAGLAAALRGLGTGVMPPSWDRLGSVSMPVTLVVGERDSKFLGIAQRMAAALPDARLVIVPHAGHAAHLERPDTVAAALRGRPTAAG